MQETNREDAFKIYFKDSIRRVTLNSKKFQNVVTQMNKLYNADGLYHPELKIQYVDEEGDKVTVSSQVEWDEMFAGVGDSRPIKLYVSEGAMAGKYFKDGPAPVVKEIYVKDTSEKKTAVEDVKELSVAAPRSLSRIFPGGKILPYNLPEWLNPAVTVKATGKKEDVDLDVDIFKLIEVLHQQGYSLLDEGNPEESKKYFLSILDVAPNHKTANYNLACAEALSGNADGAVEYLKNAVEAGYNNVTHLVKDSDLDSIRTHAGYVAIVKQFTAEEEAEKQRIAAEEAERERIAEEKLAMERHIAEQKRLAEEQRIAEEKRLAEEQRRRNEEAARIAAEERRKAEEAAQRAAEEQRKAEEAARIAAEQQRKAEEAAKKLEEEKKLREAEEAEKKRKEEEEAERKRKEAEEIERKRQESEEAQKKRKEAEQAALKNYRYASQLKNLLGMGFDVNVAKMLLDNFNGDFDKSLEALLKMQ